MLFSVVVSLQTPDEGLISRTPGGIMTPVNYFKIQEVLSLTVTDNVLCIRVHFAQNKTEKTLVYANMR